MINKFAARCAKCGKQVPPGQGDSTKALAGWRTVHHTCPPPLPSRTYFRMLDDYDDECFERTGMTNAEFKDAVNPDEGDKG